MNLEDEINFGHMSLNTLDELIDSNIAAANELQVRLSKKYQNKVLYGRIYDGKQLISEQSYSGAYDHKLSAQMHYDWSVFLSHLVVARRGNFRRKKGAQESGITIGEKIQNRSS